MKHLWILFALAFLAACGLTTEGDMWRAAIIEKGAKVADEKLKSDIWGICEGNFVGAIDRYFGQSQELADLWRRLCHREGDVTLFTPMENM